MELGDYQDLEKMKFIFDRLEFIIGIILGGGVSSLITYKITINKNAARDVVEGDHIEYHGYHIPSAVDSARAFDQTPFNRETDVPSLNSTQTHILNKVQKKVIQKFIITSSFPESYPNSIKYLNINDAKVCASEYHSAFMDLVTTFVNPKTYSSQQPTIEQLTDFETSFRQIKIFVDNSSNDLQVLKGHIEDFENSLIKLLSFI